MTDNERIMRDQVKSLLITVQAIRSSAAWEAVPEDIRELVDLAIEEAREAIGEGDPCEVGTCQWQG